MITRYAVRNLPPACLLGIAALLVLPGRLAGVQAAADKDAAPKKNWETGFNAGLNLTRGNSKTMLLNGGIISEYKKNANEFRLEIQGAYGENTVDTNGGTNSVERTTVQNAAGIANYKRLFTERDYGYLNGELAHDHMAGIDYRLIAGPGLGRFLLKSGSQALNADAGVVYVRQQLSSELHNTVNLRLAQRYEIKLPASSKLWEALEYMPVLNDFGNYIFNLEVGAEAAMTERVNLRVVLQDRFNSRPAQGKEKNDLQLTAGIGYKF